VFYIVVLIGSSFNSLMYIENMHVDEAIERNWGADKKSYSPNSCRNGSTTVFRPTVTSDMRIGPSIFLRAPMESSPVHFLENFGLKLMSRRV